MCGLRKILWPIVFVALVLGTYLMATHSVNSQEVTCNISLAKAQAQVASVDGKTLVVAAPQDLSKLDAVIRVFTKGEVGLEDGTNAVMLVQAKGQVFIAEFKDKCLVTAGPISESLMTVMLGVIAGDK